MPEPLLRLTSLTCSPSHSEHLQAIASPAVLAGIAAVIHLLGGNLFVVRAGAAVRPDRMSSRAHRGQRRQRVQVPSAALACWVLVARGDGGLEDELPEC